MISSRLELWASKVSRCSIEIPTRGYIWRATSDSKNPHIPKRIQPNRPSIIFGSSRNLSAQHNASLFIRNLFNRNPLWPELPAANLNNSRHPRGCARRILDASRARVGPSGIQVSGLARILAEKIGFKRRDRDFPRAAERV